MKYDLRKLTALLLGMLLLAMLVPAAYAADPIELDRDCALTIEYSHDETLLPEAKFSVYRVADTDEYAKMTLTSAFSGYSIHLEDLDQEEWQKLAVTLKGYAQRDKIKANAQGTTDKDGKAEFMLKPGLYLVFAENAVTVENETYVSDPFMIFLPTLDRDTEEWQYQVTASPKNTTPTIALKVLKVWDDVGFETIRPTEITVTLLRDGEPFETVKLNKANDWRYDWSDLDPNREYDWSVVEDDLENYKQEITREGTTFVIKNTYREPGVVKKITGGKPSKASEFIFLLKAKDPKNPMPEGSKNGVKELTCKGAGGVNFEIEFEAPGTYIYTIKEKNTGISGYTYDTTVYTLTYIVREAEDPEEEFIVELRIRDQAGKAHEKIEFTNKYAGGGGGGGGDLPQTGQLWWPVPVLLAAGLMLMLLGIVRRRVNKDE